MTSLEATLLFQHCNSVNDLSESASVEKTSNPTARENFTIIGDEFYGEPLVTQRFLIDFTPNKEVDNAIIQKKICSFWEFIKNTPEIQNLMVLPERGNLIDASRSQEDQNLGEPFFPDIKTESKEKSIDLKRDRTALSIIEFAEKKGIMDNVLEIKVPKSLCSLSSREYKESDTQEKIEPRAYKTPCCPYKLVKTRKMCKIMEEWDSCHPKSMEPPVHSPSLQRAVERSPY